MDATQESLLKELQQSKNVQRKVEQNSMNEKEVLLRKLQFVQTYGTIIPPSVAEGGYFTDKRGELRRSADQKAQKQLQKLNVWYLLFNKNSRQTSIFFFFDCRLSWQSKRTWLQITGTKC